MNQSGPETLTILMADDDIDDCDLTARAFRVGRLNNTLRFVHDGEELLDYLLLRGKYSDPESAPRPGIILLDLNMPRLDGREALAVIKSDPALRTIPVVVLTTSDAETDVVKSYDLGVNAYITKPVAFDNLVDIVQKISGFWLEIVRLPEGASAAR